MSDRRASRTRRTHPIGREAKFIEAIAALRAGFQAPVALTIGAPDGPFADALAAALGGARPAPVVDWRLAGPKVLKAAFEDAPDDAPALVLAAEIAALRRGAAHARALDPDVVLFEECVDPSLALETVERLGRVGAVVLNADDPRCTGCLAALEDVPGLRVAAYGRRPGAAVRVLDAQFYTTCSAACLQVGRDSFDMSIGAPGFERLDAALAALTAVKALGGDVAAASARFSGLRAD
ncbi:MAG: hypothetical protein RIB45_09420 [Marivibrio sp.]|uniref:hypothetical protein n=1 Tax=Marivibrio sp. TaxID=2039719 RepID=UPI0032EF0CC2